MLTVACDTPAGKVLFGATTARTPELHITPAAGAPESGRYLLVVAAAQESAALSGRITAEWAFRSARTTDQVRCPSG